MLPKADPYATKSAKTVDLFLILFVLATIVFVFLTAPRHRRDDGRLAPPAAADAFPARVAVHSPPGSPILLTSSARQREP